MAKPFKRTCQLGLLAKDLLALRCQPRDTPGREPRIQAVVDRLGLLHGLPQKIGQLLAFSDLPDSQRSFSRLTEDKASMPPEEAFAAMETELGRPLSECFDWVDPDGIAASIGQVHRGRARDGQDVAIKVQHPNIAEQIEWDLQALGWLSAPLGDLRKGFAIEAYRHEIGDMLRRELDYRLEADAGQLFAARTRSLDPISIPQLIPELSGKRILTTTWIDGYSIHATSSWSLPDRTAVADALARFFLNSLFVWNSLHADPHPGNYRFMPRTATHGPRLGVIDFGCIKTVSPTLAGTLTQLIRHGMSHTLDEGNVFEAFVRMGFQEASLNAMRSKLVSIAEALCFPFKSRVPTPVSEWALGERLATILKEDRQRFRTSGSPELIYILRTLQGVLRHLDCLNAPIAWREHFQRLEIETGTTKPAPTSRPPSPPPHFMKSESLHIQVNEAERTKVALTFSADATDHLDQLIPVEYREKLRQHDINLNEISDRARKSGYAPGALFSLEEGSKTVRVWLA